MDNKSIIEMLISQIADESENYKQYKQLCTHYQIQQDPIALAKHLATLHTLRTILDKIKISMI